MEYLYINVERLRLNNRTVISREIQESELQKFYGRLLKLLQTKEFGHETVDSLQRLHLILSATKYTRT